MSAPLVLAGFIDDPSISNLSTIVASLTPAPLLHDASIGDWTTGYEQTLLTDGTFQVAGVYWVWVDFGAIRNSFSFSAAGTFFHLNDPSFITHNFASLAVFGSNVADFSVHSGVAWASHLGKAAVSPASGLYRYYLVEVYVGTSSPTSTSMEVSDFRLYDYDTAAPITYVDAVDTGGGTPPPPTPVITMAKCCKGQAFVEWEAPPDGYTTVQVYKDSILYAVLGPSIGYVDPISDYVSSHSYQIKLLGAGLPDSSLSSAVIMAHCKSPGCQCCIEPTYTVQQYAPGTRNWVTRRMAFVAMDMEQVI